MSTIKQLVLGLICLFGIISPGALYTEGYNGTTVLSVIIISIGMLYFKYKWATNYFKDMAFWQAFLWCYAAAVFVLYLLALDLSINKAISVSDTFAYFLHNNTSLSTSVFVTPVLPIIISLYIFRWVFNQSKPFPPKSQETHELSAIEPPAYKKENPINFVSYDENKSIHLKTNKVIDYAFNLHAAHPDLSIRSILTMHRDDFEEIQSIMSDDMALEFELSVTSTLRKLREI